MNLWYAFVAILMHCISTYCINLSLYVQSYRTVVQGNTVPLDLQAVKPALLALAAPMLKPRTLYSVPRVLMRLQGQRAACSARWATSVMLMGWLRLPLVYLALTQTPLVSVCRKCYYALPQGQPLSIKNTLCIVFGSIYSILIVLHLLYMKLVIWTEIPKEYLKASYWKVIVSGFLMAYTSLKWCKSCRFQLCRPFTLYLVIIMFINFKMPHKDFSCFETWLM